MAKADGSVIINTRIDSKSFASGAKQLSSKGAEACQKLSAGFSKLGVIIGAALSVGKIIQFGAAASKAAREYSDALIGLQSIVEGQGRSFSNAQAFIEEYTKDGLIPATNAITAYKNLALRGYDDSQIKQVMIALKDASAYGRAASYSMGDAVQSATEGLKNENSILVDNAGVTKNVAKMWDEYAASIGTTANNLTQQQKIQAEVAGIMAETKFQTGDAAKVSGTLSGQLQQLSFNFNSLKVAVGGIVNPIVQYVLPAINAAVAGFTKLANAAAQVVSLLFGKVSTSGGGLAEQNNAIAGSAIAGAEAEEKLADATKAAGKAAKQSLAGFDELNTLQDKASGSGGSPSIGGSSGGGVTNAPSIEATTEIQDTISPKLKEIAEKFKSLVEPLQKIDFKPAVNSIKKLGDSFKNLGSAIGNALEWAWKDILVPLSKWAIEEAAPELIDTLSAAFDALAEAAKPVISGLDRMMDHLQPVFRFIGENVLLVLSKFKERFQLMAQTLQEKAPKIEKSIAAVGEIFAIIWAKIEPICTKLRDLWSKTVSFISNLSSTGVGVMIDVFYGLVEFLAGAFSGDWSRAWKGIQSIFTSVGDAIGKNAAALEKATGIPFTNIYNNAKTKFNDTKTAILNAWDAVKNSNTWNTIKSNLYSAWDDIRSKAETKFGNIRDTISSAWKNAMSSLSGGNVDFSVIGTNIKDAFASGINKLIAGLNDALYRIIYRINDVILDARAIHYEILGKTHYPFYNIPTIPQFAIPYLAKGAVIPPNAPFMAMLGDQKHGTNIEAPLSTIQEAVALVLEDMTGGLMAGFEATVAVLREILEAILGIEIGDTVIAEAVERYNRKMSVVKGG